MPRIYPLFSSSSGNCTYVGTSAEGVLIDCGASFTKIKNALNLNGLSLVFITHDHSDHVKGLKVLTKKTGLPVYSQCDTLDVLYDMGLISSSSEDIKDFADIGNMRISCFPTSHDTIQSCGYRVTFEDVTLKALLGNGSFNGILYLPRIFHYHRTTRQHIAQHMAVIPVYMFAYHGYLLHRYLTWPLCK